jgi:glycosyltransferase involved in cell wall biosynthesis
MKVLIISPIDVIPTNQGAARRIIDIGKTLAESGHNVTIIDITLNSFFRNMKPKEILKEQNIEIIKSGFFRNSVFRRILHSDIIQFEFPFLFFIMILLKLLGKNYILDEHDVEFSLSQSMKQQTVSQTNKSTFHFLNVLLQQTPVFTLLVESISLKFSSKVFACSSQDAVMLSKIFKVSEEKIVVVPNCARASLFKDIKKLPLDRQAIVFVGSFRHLPNIYGAKILIEQIIPAVQARSPNVLFMIIGPDPPQWLVAQNSKGVLVTGKVDDVRPFVAAADVAIAPIYQGSGTRLKILEYMHLGKPIVSTVKGAEGLDVVDGVNILLRDDPVAFAAAITQLLTDIDLASALSKNSHELAIKKYSWETNVKKIIDVYNEYSR